MSTCQLATDADKKAFFDNSHCNVFPSPVFNDVSVLACFYNPSQVESKMSTTHGYCIPIDDGKSRMCFFSSDSQQKAMDSCQQTVMDFQRAKLSPLK